MQDIKKQINEFTVNDLAKRLNKKYCELINSLKLKNVYIWGFGRLGKFACVQCSKNGIYVKGFIDNDLKKVKSNDNVFTHSVLQTTDIVIVASFFYPQIIEQLKTLNIKDYIYYEELATVVKGFDIYYQAFSDCGRDIQDNKKEYIKIYDALEDKLSKEIYSEIMRYKMSLDVCFTQKAFELSISHGRQDFDELIVSRLGKSSVFYDVGGFDGDSTIDFIHCVNKYSKIYFFEPDANIMAKAKKRLENEKNIVFVQAIVGNKRGKEKYDAIGGGAGIVSEKGKEVISVVMLDDFIEDGTTYIKMDVEGYELQTLQGAKKFISKYKPMLSVSVYHKPGDMLQLVNYILSLNPDYKIYMRHYTKFYADTRCYFI